MKKKIKRTKKTYIFSFMNIHCYFYVINCDLYARLFSCRYVFVLHYCDCDRHEWYHYCSSLFFFSSFRCYQNTTIPSSSLVFVPSLSVRHAHHILIYTCIWTNEEVQQDNTSHKVLINVLENTTQNSCDVFERIYQCTVV